jgi:hypothetical protein
LDDLIRPHHPGRAPLTSQIVSIGDICAAADKAARDVHFALHPDNSLYRIDMTKRPRPFGTKALLQLT